MLTSTSKSTGKPVESDDYTVPRTKIYCEDDYFAENCLNSYHLKCDQSLQHFPEPPLPFDYFRFNEYLRLKSQIECINRSVEASRGNLSPGVEYYTNACLLKELFLVYGDMDEKCEKFQLMFQNYKEQRLEQIQEWTENEKKLMRETREGEHNQSDPVQEFVNEEEFLMSHFSLEDIVSFKAVAAGSINPFRLPRKTSWKNEHDMKKPTGNRKSRNSKGHLAQRNELVTSEVKNVLKQHPHGLTRDKLLQICNERLGRKALPGVIVNLNSEMIDGYLSKEKVLFTKKFFQEGGLVFPAIQQCTVSNNDPMDTLWNLRHKLLVILNLCMGIVEVNECIDLYRKIFKNETFPYNQWGFETGLDLIKWLFVQKWCSNGVEVIQPNLRGQGKSGGKHYYLAVMTDKRKLLLEKKTVPIETANACKNKTRSVPSLVESPLVTSSSKSHRNIPLSSLSSNPWKKPATLVPNPQTYKPPILNYDPTNTTIDSKYVQFGERITREESEIKAGTEFDCVVSLMNSPTNFYLVKTVRWGQLDKLFDELRDYWITHPTALSPHPQFLQRNYLCLAKTNSREKLEVYRVVILGKPDPHHYQVFCIDYGDILKVGHDQLRYLPKDFLYNVDAQAISCSLYNVASPTKDRVTGNDIWSKSVCEFATKLFCPNDLPIVKVLFKQKMMGTGKWLVKVSSRTITDFGEDVMKFVNKGK